MRIADLELVRKLPLFTAMSETGFDTLMHGAYLQQFPPHLQLIAQGEDADFLHVLIEGRVELYAEANGREATLFIAYPVTTFILAAVLQDTVHLMSARTMERSRLLLIPASDLRRTFAGDPALAHAMLLDLASNYRGVVKTLKNHKLRPSLERLANYLLSEEQAQGANRTFDLPIDKKILASMLGMTPENLSRAFNALRPYGVTVDGRAITLPSGEDLQRLARPSPLIDDPAS